MKHSRWIAAAVAICAATITSPRSSLSEPAPALVDSLARQATMLGLQSSEIYQLPDDCDPWMKDPSRLAFRDDGRVLIDVHGFLPAVLGAPDFDPESMPFFFIFVSEAGASFFAELPAGSLMANGTQSVAYKNPAGKASVGLEHVTLRNHQGKAVEIDLAAYFPAPPMSDVGSVNLHAVQVGRHAFGNAGEWKLLASGNWILQQSYAGEPVPALCTQCKPFRKDPGMITLGPTIDSIEFHGTIDRADGLNAASSPFGVTMEGAGGELFTYLLPAGSLAQTGVTQGKPILRYADPSIDPMGGIAEVEAVPHGTGYRVSIKVMKEVSSEFDSLPVGDSEEMFASVDISGSPYCSDLIGRKNSPTVIQLMEQKN